MLFFIICTLLKKYSNKSWMRKIFAKGEVVKISIQNIFINFFLLYSIVSIGQNSELNYKVVRNGNNIGWLRLEKNVKGNKSDLQLISEVKTKLVFPIKISAKESSTFENGKLIQSSQIRKTNGTTKLNKQTKFVTDAYEVSENGEKKRLSIPYIETNLLSLFFKEPTNLKPVYSDKQQRFIRITKTDDGGYKTSFEKGCSNSYYYKDGICVKVKIEHSFYTAEIVMNY